jgi:hypothetical protein
MHEDIACRMLAVESVESLQASSDVFWAFVESCDELLCGFN